MQRQAGGQGSCYAASYMQGPCEPSRSTSVVAGAYALFELLQDKFHRGLAFLIESYIACHHENLQAFDHNAARDGRAAHRQYSVH